MVGRLIIIKMVFVVVFFVSDIVVEGLRIGFVWWLSVGCVSVWVAVLKAMRRTVHCFVLLVVTWW
jgi:hypothetical protein